MYEICAFNTQSDHLGVQMCFRTKIDLNYVKSYELKYTLNTYCKISVGIIVLNSTVVSYPSHTQFRCIYHTEISY